MYYKLHELAQKLGIMTNYSSGGLIHSENSVDEDVIKFMTDMLGYPAWDSASAEQSLNKISDLRFERALEGIYVVKDNDISFDIVLDKANYNDKLSVKALTVEGNELNLNYYIEDGLEFKKIGHVLKGRKIIKIKDVLPVGYYALTVVVGESVYSTTLAVVPYKCYEAPLLSEKKLWGFALQLYSLKSRRNWGVGDFTDLSNFIDICGEIGASIIGLNPLNVLSHNYPENASPYLSVSRLFVNPIYIDIEQVPEFEQADIIGSEDKLEEFRNSELIQYALIYPFKMEFMEKFYKRFKDSENQDRKLEFARFQIEQGIELDKLAVFQALYEEKSKIIWGGWQAWEEEFKSPYSAEVAEYAKEHHDKIEFFKFLQFEAQRQLNLVHDKVAEKKLSIGLYNDLAVGVGKDSAEVWSGKGVFLEGAGAGAPPDMFFPFGQKWNLGAFNPYKLKDSAYEPFIRVLRANMKSAGALRIDHVMQLMRLYIIPEKYDAGTYLLYNFDDMINIVMLESHLQQCTIVGESIGNVPAGFLERLSESNIKSLSVIWAERYNDGWGDFKQPDAYPNDAFVSVGTHDMAPLKMWWFGYDIALSYDLGLFKSEEDRNNSYHKRENDRWKLLAALDHAGVWPEDRPRSGDYVYGEAYPDGIEEAVHRFVSRSNCKVFLAQLEDILQIEELQNLPGTDRDKHPNWRRKLNVDLEDLASHELFVRNIVAIKKER